MGAPNPHEFRRVDVTGAPVGVPAAPEDVVGPAPVIATASVARPADTTQYASGDLIANSTTAGAVAPLAFTVTRAAGKGGMIRRARIRKSATTLTAAAFRLHLYRTAPTPANGDNGAWLTNKAADYIGSVDVTCDRAFNDGACGFGVPNIGSEINVGVDTIYGLLEARDAYTPASGETIAVELEVLPN